MVDYSSNSNKARSRINEKSEEKAREKLDPVIEGGASVKKKTGLIRFRDIFCNEDAEDIKSFILENLFNAIKRGGFNLIIDSIEFMFGENYYSNRSSGGRENYRRYYDDRNRNDYKGHRPEYRERGFDFDNLYFNSYGSADRVLDELRYRIYHDKRDYITILEFYEVSNADTDNYTYDDFGWSSDDLQRAEIKRSGRDYYISFPRAKSIRDLERR